MTTTPEDSRYAKSHEYVHVEGDTGTIGITDYAQKELGDVVFVELPPSARSSKSATSSARSNPSKQSPSSSLPHRAKWSK